jgi:uncharacterized protein YqhQ
LAAWLKTGVRQVILPALVLVLLDSLAALIFFGQAQTFWLFKNTRNWIEMVADLTFTEGVICLIIAGVTGSGRAEHSTLLDQTQDEVPVDIERYRARREKSISQAFQFAEIGVILILLTFVLHFLSG